MLLCWVLLWHIIILGNNIRRTRILKSLSLDDIRWLMLPLLLYRRKPALLLTIILICLVVLHQIVVQTLSLSNHVCKYSCVLNYFVLISIESVVNSAFNLENSSVLNNSVYTVSLMFTHSLNIG